MLQPRAELDAGGGGGVGVVVQGEGTAARRLGIAGQVIGGRLEGCIGRDRGNGRFETVAGLGPAGVAVGVEIRVEHIAEHGALGVDVVEAVGKCTGDIGVAKTLAAIEAGIEGVGAAAAQAVRQRKVAPAAAQAEADQRVVDMIAQAADQPPDVCRGIVRSDGGIAAGLLGPAIGGAPHIPASRENRLDLVGVMAGRMSEQGKPLVGGGLGVIGIGGRSASLNGQAGSGFQLAVERLEELVGTVEAGGEPGGRQLA